MRRVQVSLPGREYPIFIDGGLIPRLGAYCKKISSIRRAAIITDSNVARRWAGPARRSLKSAGFEPLLITLPAGESTKCLRRAAECYDALARFRIERRSLLIALGGGVVGDLAGFVAATYLRGLPFVQVPTTLLAQVDSSVGGKVGLNLEAGKNLVGAFYQPKLVLCDLAALATLPDREFRAGLAEVIKYGIIYDAKLFRLLETRLDEILERQPELLAQVIARCCAIKADVVARDETETGLRAILNFGHTLGHALEAISGYKKYLHGEAISVGQIAAARISARQTGLAQTETNRIQRLFTRAGLPVAAPLSAAQRQALFNAMRLDKKISDGKVKFVLAERIGRVRWGQSVPEALLDEVLDQISAAA